MWFFTSPKIVFGPGAIEFLASLAPKKTLLVADRELVRLKLHEPVVEQVLKAGGALELYGQVDPEPKVSVVEAGVELARKFQPDLIVGFGGGSSMDVAKAIYALYERSDLTVYDLTPLIDLNLGAKCKLVQIPTTSGTGSETTWATVLTEGEGGRKLELAHRDLVAGWAVLDPLLTRSLPPRISADGGADALCHAIEAIHSEWSNPFSDGMARQAVGTLFQYLPRAVGPDPSLEVREEVHYAASMAGLAFGNAQVGINHALGHALGSVFKLPHGRTVGLFLPYSLEFNFGAAREKLQKLGPVLGEANVRTGRDLSAKVRTLWDGIGMAKTIPDAVKVSEEDFLKALPELVERADQSPSMTSNARVPSTQELERLFRAAWSGTPVDF